MHTAEAQLALIKQDMESIPGDARERHVASFANTLFTRMCSVSPAVKFRYVRAGLGRVGDNERAREAREDATTGVVTELVGTWNGQRFSSPNDIAVRSDGTVYFTDPDYGLTLPGDREIAFNGVFRVPPGGAAVAEWQGTVGVNQPNGVVLSPDEQTLYVTDTHQGRLLAFDVAGDGSLSGLRVLRAGLQIPDGMSVDVDGNVWIATWAPSLEVVTADGTPWGTVPLPQSGTNCAFGGADLRTLYVTAGTGLFSLATTLPGLPDRP
jgi:gluconolactonase